MPSIFSRIVQGEIPCYKIAESEDYFAFLDIRPSAKGHTLVIPKQETDYLFDLEDDTLSGLMLFAKQVAKAIEAAIPCKRVGVLVVGTEVPHAHVHLIPFQQERQMDVTAKRLVLDAQEMAEIAEAIRQKIVISD